MLDDARKAAGDGGNPAIKEPDRVGEYAVADGRGVIHQRMPWPNRHDSSPQSKSGRPDFDWGRGGVRGTISAECDDSSLPDRLARGDLDAEAREAHIVVIGRGQQADRGNAEILEDLRAEADLAPLALTRRFR